MKIKPWRAQKIPSGPPTRSISSSNAGMSESCNNRVTNTKYTFLTFLPMNLFEQFSRPINFYFLIISILQLFPQLTPVNPLTTWLPLTFAFMLTAAKEGYDDYQRYKDDKLFNERIFTVISGGSKKDVMSQDIKPGDIVLVNDHDLIPADLILLCSSEPQFQAFIQTMSLDGETDLKSRFAPVGLSAFFDGKEVCESLRSSDLSSKVGLPSSDIYRCDGQLFLENSKFPVTSENVLLQYTNLRNTKWAYGLVVYAGNETKCGMNKRRPPSKNTQDDNFINKLAIGIFIFQLFVAVSFGAVGESLKNTRGRHSFYLAFPSFDPWYERLVIPLRFLLLCSMMIPISLKVTLDLIRYAYSLFIDWDTCMYDAVNNVPAKALSTSLAEDLGRVEWVLTDKTGTLTQNVMRLQSMSVRGTVVAVDPTTAPILDSADAPSAQLLRAFALCNCVVPVKLEDDTIIYKSASPDEEALVAAAASYGVILRERTHNRMVLSVLGVEERYDILETLPFSSVRKRMTIVLKKEGDDAPLVWIKGADDVILPRIVESEKDTCHAETENLHKFALQGLRTLCFGTKTFGRASFKIWHDECKEASLAIQDRDALLTALFERIECDFSLVGSSAIEDELQDGVPETIFCLRKAGLVFWMLTGDKYETALQIAVSCQLFHPSSESMVEICGDDKDSIRRSLSAVEQEYLCSSRLFCLIVRGSTLRVILDDENLIGMFSDLSFHARAVICCRVSPLQKAAIVKLAKVKGKICLAIGDGGNDVSMIQEAHVGVGISGREGLQAARAADYSIGQFRFLSRLILVHGHLSHYRTSFIAQYSFYKSMIIAFVQVLFNCYTMFSGTTFFNSLSLMSYNVVFTFLPAFLFILDQPIPAEVLESNPRLYSSSRNRLSFTIATFFGWVFRAVFQSLVLFFVTISVYSQSYADPVSGSPIDYNSVSMVTFTALVHIQLLTVIVESSHITKFNVGIVLLCGFSYWVLAFIYTAIPSTSFYMVMILQCRTAVFWLAFFLMLCVCVIPVIGWKYISWIVWPSPIWIARSLFLPLSKISQMSA
eukprot:ANDGO_06225.mRNA.1 Phospholipid-transporting ATPase 2